MTISRFDLGHSFGDWEVSAAVGEYRICRHCHLSDIYAEAFNVKCSTQEESKPTVQELIQGLQNKITDLDAAQPALYEQLGRLFYDNRGNAGYWRVTDAANKIADNGKEKARLHDLISAIEQESKPCES